MFVYVLSEGLILLDYYYWSFYLYWFYKVICVNCEISYKKKIPNKVDEIPITVKAIKYTSSEKRPKKNVVIIPAINCDSEYNNVNIALYLPLFYLPLHISRI